MKKILLITTGGTIASIQTKSGLIPGIDGKNLIDYIPNIINNNPRIQLGHSRYEYKYMLSKNALIPYTFSQPKKQCLSYVKFLFFVLIDFKFGH